MALTLIIFKIIWDDADKLFKLTNASTGFIYQTWPGQGNASYTPDRPPTVTTVNAIPSHGMATLADQAGAIMGWSAVTGSEGGNSENSESALRLPIANLSVAADPDGVVRVRKDGEAVTTVSSTTLSSADKHLLPNKLLARGYASVTAVNLNIGGSITATTVSALASA